MEFQTYYYHTRPSKKESRITFAGVVKDNVLTIAQARCSKKDMFSKKKGREIALGRALKSKKEILANFNNPGPHPGKLFVAACKLMEAARTLSTEELLRAIEDAQVPSEVREEILFPTN